MTLGVSPAAAARATEGSEEAKQHVRAPTVRPMGGRRSQHKILPPTTAASLASFDGRDGPSTPDAVEVTGRSARGSGDGRGADARGDDHRAAASAHDQPSLARRLDASPAASPAAPRVTSPLGAADARRRAEETLADDGTPVGLRFVITASCDAQENLSAVPTASAEDAEPPRSVLRPEFPTFETLEAAAASFAHASFGVPVPIPSSSPHGSVSLSQSQSQSGVPSVARNFSESLRATTSGSVADASILKKPEDVAREVARLLKAATALVRGGAGGRFADGQALVDQALRLAPENVEAVCAAGACHFSAGKLEEAYARFSFALELRPNHVPALQALGLLYQTRGMLPEAARAYAAAIASHEEQSSALARSRDGSSGGTRRDENENAGSVAATRARLAATLSDIGTQVKLEGDVNKAMSHYREAISVDPSYAPALYNLGVALHELGQSAAAEARYAEAAALDPKHADALCNLGVMRKLRGDVAGSVAAYEACLAVNPNHAHGTSNMAIALNDMANAAKVAGDVPAAIRIYERALTFDSNSADSMYNLGVAQAEVGELDRAVIAYETTLKLRPGCAEAWNNLGVLLRERGNVPRAVECYKNAISLKPHFAQACNNLGVLCTVQGKAQEALQALQSAVAADPEYAVAHNNVGVLLRDTGDVHEALRSYQECMRLSPDDRNASQNYLLALNYVFPGQDARVCDAHVAWGRRMAELVGEPMPPRAFDEARDAGAGETICSYAQTSRDIPVARRSASVSSLGTSSASSRDDLKTLESESSFSGAETGAARQPPPRSRRLVVGYVSPDMYTHSVSYFAAAPLRHHDPARVRLIVYSATPVEDARTGSLRASVAASGGEWRDVAALSERALAELIRHDGVDVLVELTGHTANNRLATLALRPAPVQVTWMGYPNSTGMAGAVAYRVTDKHCDPEDTKQTFAETSVRLPGCFLCYTPHPEAPPVARAPCLANGFVTFGCFNALAKVTPAVRALWGKLLRAVPNSRLVVKAKPFACASVQRRFLSAMAAEGVASWRVDVRALVDRTSEHLGAYGEIDVALDTFPYAGTTTTCEALWSGVPVVTLRGEAHAHNVGVSLLRTVGIERECVAENPEAYVAKCAALAADHAALGLMRERMREKMRAPGGLCDGEAFTQKLEEAYVAMWRRHCEESRVAAGR